MVRIDLTPARPEGRQAARRPGRVAVNGREIPRGDIARETQNHPAARPVDAWMAAARALVVRELLLQEAERLAIEPDPATDDEGRRETDEESRIRLLVERAVVTPVATEAECRRIYDAAPDRFRTPDLHAVSHILVAAPPYDAGAREAARSEALRIAAAAGADESLFAALAGAHSACPSGRVGGSLGQIGPGQTVPEFEAAIAVLPVGRTAAEPVETRYGFHVVRVEQRIAGEPLPFAAVRAAIADRLADRARRTAIRQYIALLAGQAEVEGIPLDAASSPLVQ
jgi:peptidyl-prolyl cis-trans isomerase C